MTPSFAESNMTKLDFTCSKEHTFAKTIRAVVSRGGWCDFCRNQVPANQAEAESFLGESDWILLSPYEAVTLDVKVRCRECGLEKQGPYHYYQGKPCHHIGRSSVPIGLVQPIRIHCNIIFECSGSQPNLPITLTSERLAEVG